MVKSWWKSGWRWPCWRFSRYLENRQPSFWEIVRHATLRRVVSTLLNSMVYWKLQGKLYKRNVLQPPVFSSQPKYITISNVACIIIFNKELKKRKVSIITINHINIMLGVSCYE